MAPEVAYDKWASPLIENPTAAAVDSDKGILYVYDAAHNRIVGLDGAGNCTSVIGSGRREFKDDVLTQAGFNSINGMCYNDNKLYLADAYNHRIRIVDLNSNRVSTLLGNGLMPADPSKGSEEIPKSMGLPTAVAMWNGELMAASGFTNEIFKINIADGKTTRFARTKDTGKTPDGVFIRSMTANKEFLYVAMSNGDLILYDKNGAQNVVVKGNTFKPSYLTIWKSNIVATGMHSNNVCMLDKGEWLAISGNGVKGDKDGKAYEASFNTPTGMAVLNGELIICDTKNHQLRKLSSPKNGNMRTLYYVPNRELIGEAAAHTEGEMVVMDTIVVGKSNTKIHVSLDLGNYKLIPEWSNADIDELDGAWLTTQEVTEDGFDFMINSKFEGSDVYLELYLLLEDPIVKGVYIVKRSYLSFYIESKNSAPAGQSKVYKVNVLPQ
jgi:DNA-binding beta-propeller fold protein YncE